MKLAHTLLAAVPLVSILHAAPAIKITASVDGEAVAIANGDITAGDPGQDFGTVNGGVVDGVTESRTIFYTLTNTGTSQLNITSSDTSPAMLLFGGGQSDEFGLSHSFPRFLAPGASEEFRIIYIPKGQSAGAIFNLDTTDGPFQFAVSGDGNIGDPEVFHLLNETERWIPNNDDNPTFNKGTNFGEVLINTPVNDNPINILTVRNRSDSDTLILSGAVLIGTNSSLFSLANLGGTLQPGTERNFQVRFDPDSVGLKTASVRFNTNDPDNPTYTFDLIGEGITQPGILVEGSQVFGGTYRLVADGSTASGLNATDFGGIGTGASDTHWFRITNTGDGSLDLSGAGASGSVFAVNDFPASVAPGATETFSVTFSPDDPQPYDETFAFSTNLGGNLGIYSFELAGSGLGPQISLERLNANESVSVIPNGGNAIDFDLVVTGQTPLTSLPLRIRNTGNQTLGISNYFASGPGSGQFEISGLPGLPSPFFSLEPDETREFQLIFTPTEVPASPGIVNYDFQIQGSGMMFDFGARANVFAGTTLELTGRPGAGAFQPVLDNGAPRLANGTTFAPPQSTPSTTSHFRFRNVGSKDLYFGGPQITGPDAAEFEVVGFSTTPVVPGATRDFSIVFTPTDAEIKNATLEILTTDSGILTLTVPLLGNSTDPGIEPAERIISFTLDGSDGELLVATVPGRSYRLKQSDTLTDPWTDVPGVGVITGSASPQSIPVPNIISPGVTARFFRLEEE